MMSQIGKKFHAVSFRWIFLWNIRSKKILMKWQIGAIMLLKMNKIV